MEVKFGKTATFTGNRSREVTVTSDGRVGKDEARGADLFLPSIQDARVTSYLRSGDVADLGSTWQPLPDPNPQRHKTLSADCGDGSVWKYGGTQQVNADFASRTVSLDTVGKDGRHTITAHFERGSGKIVPQTITESFEPYNAAYVAMMRDCY